MEEWKQGETLWYVDFGARDLATSCEYDSECESIYFIVTRGLAFKSKSGAIVKAHIMLGL